jgi:hypothetical protein
LHIIRLREPWRANSSPDSSPASINYSRKFHRPTGVAAGQMVELRVRPSDTRLVPVATLNSQPVELVRTCEEFLQSRDILVLLATYNELVLEIPLDETTMKNLLGGQLVPDLSTLLSVELCIHDSIPT